jgi:L-lactate dehydrogenase complex protein LldG
MGSREKILQTIRQNKPAFTEAPVIFLQQQPAADLIQQFITTLESIGGKAFRVNSMEEVKEDLQRSVAQGGYIVNTIPSLGAVNSEITALSDAHTLEPVFKTYIQGELAVAENGSVWLDEKNMVNRLLPFICQHLILVVNIDRIVATMHDAYQQITIDKEGYGLFLAGPSKTADIEQSLVIGAHGARSLVVYLL